MKYVPEACPGNPEEISEYLMRELYRVQSALEQMHTHDIVHTAPTRPTEGQVIYADGTDWNPGSGAGLYERKGGAWVKL